MPDINKRILIPVMIFMKGILSIAGLVLKIIQIVFQIIRNA